MLASLPNHQLWFCVQIVSSSINCKPLNCHVKQDLLCKSLIFSLLQAAAVTVDSGAEIVASISALLEPSCRLVTCMSPVQVDSKSPAESVCILSLPLNLCSMPWCRHYARVARLDDFD